MAVAKDVDQILLLEHDEEFITDEELLLLQDLNNFQNFELPYWKYQKFDLDNWSDDECWVDFRFRKNELEKLLVVLRLPNEIITYNRLRVDAMEALCLMLIRLAYPCRYSDLVTKFARPVPMLSIIFNHILDYTYNTFSHLLTSFNQECLSPANLKTYADIIHAKGAPLNNCWGFIDGTVRATCRPEKDQRLLYSRHKRKHGLKYQSVVAPNGLIVNLFGPIEASRHDSFMLAKSGLLRELELHSYSPDGSALCVYGDGGYPLSVHLQTGFRNANTDQERQFNQLMSAVRVTVEWGFGNVLGDFAFVVLLVSNTLSAPCWSNAKICLYGSKTSKFFGCQPPSLEAYFSG